MTISKTNHTMQEGSLLELPTLIQSEPSFGPFQGRNKMISTDSFLSISGASPDGGTPSSPLAGRAASLGRSPSVEISRTQNRSSLSNTPERTASASTPTTGGTPSPRNVQRAQTPQENRRPLADPLLGDAGDVHSQTDCCLNICRIISSWFGVE